MPKKPVQIQVIDPLISNSEALELISDYERRVLHGRCRKIVEVIEEEYCTRIGGLNEMLPCFG